MVTIPASMNVSEGKDFFVHPGKNGNIILVPKITDPYSDTKKGDFNTVLEYEIKKRRPVIVINIAQSAG